MKYEIDEVKDHWLNCRIPMDECKICQLLAQALKLVREDSSKQLTKEE